MALSDAEKKGRLYESNTNTSKLRKRRVLKIEKSPKSPKSSKSHKEEQIIESCDPTEVELLDFPQWNTERGYWIGEYAFLQGDGTPYESSSWNYPYDSYRGFITGEVVG